MKLKVILIIGVCILDQLNLFALDHNTYYTNFLKEKGIITKDFSGDWGVMSSQNLNMWWPLIEHAINIGDFQSALEFDAEYQLNQRSINKYWGESGKQVDSLIQTMVQR